MAVSRTFWLTVTNVALGVAALACMVGTAFAVLCGIRERLAKRRAFMAELDHDFREMFGARQGSRTAVTTRAYIDAPFETRWFRVCACLGHAGSAIKRWLGFRVSR